MSQASDDAEAALERAGFLANDPAGSIYDDPEMVPESRDFNNVTFAAVGDRVRGEILRMEILNGRYGKVAKYWLFDLDSQQERTMLAGAVDLWDQLYKLRPQVGDTVTIELVRIDNRRHIYSVEVQTVLK